MVQPYFTPMPVFDMRWHQLYPNGDVGYNWNSLAMDDDGSVIVVAGQGGAIPSVSTDYGMTWVPRKPTGSYTPFTAGDLCATTNSDGTFMAISNPWPNASQGGRGRIWTSTDLGVSWTERRPTGTNVSANWKGISCSRDGLTVLVWCDTVGGSYVGKKIYVSIDGGVTWNDRTPPPPIWWYLNDPLRSACSSNGSAMMIWNDSGGRVYRSDDQGLSWNYLTLVAATTGSWSGAMSADGVVCYAFDRTGKKFYKSTNSAVGWSEVACPYTGVTNAVWGGLSCSGDGSIVTLAGFAGAGLIYKSTDQGITWIAQTGSGKRTGYWRFCQTSYDGLTHINQWWYSTGRLWHYRDSRS